MLAGLLPPALVLLALASWVSTALLLRAAWKRPRIGALTERATIAVVLAIFGSVCVVLVLNTDSGHALIPVEAALILFRICLLILLLIPTYWLVLYLTNRLGDR
jgi:hypothetical protein